MKKIFVLFSLITLLILPSALLATNGDNKTKVHHLKTNASSATPATGSCCTLVSTYDSCCGLLRWTAGHDCHWNNGYQNKQNFWCFATQSYCYNAFSCGLVGTLSHSSFTPSVTIFDSVANKTWAADDHSVCVFDGEEAEGDYDEVSLPESSARGEKTPYLNKFTINGVPRIVYYRTSTETVYLINVNNLNVVSSTPLDLIDLDTVDDPNDPDDFVVGEAVTSMAVGPDPNNFGGYRLKATIVNIWADYDHITNDTPYDVTLFTW